MNSLSWMIYLADVAGRLDFIVGVAGLVVIVFSLGRTFVSASGVDGPFCNVANTNWYPKLLIAGAALWASGAIIPDRETIYAIAASEMGETALNSDTGNKAVKALNAWLDRQIAGEPEETE